MKTKLFIVLALYTLQGCVSRQEVEGNIWQADKLPTVLCSKYPELKTYGFFRVVKCTNRKVVGCENGEPDYEEVLSYCSTRGGKMLGAERVYVEKWLKALGKPK